MFEVKAQTFGAEEMVLGFPSLNRVIFFDWHQVFGRLSRLIPKSCNLVRLFFLVDLVAEKIVENKELKKERGFDFMLLVVRLASQLKKDSKFRFVSVIKLTTRNKGGFFKKIRTILKSL